MKVNFARQAKRINMQKPKCSMWSLFSAGRLQLYGETPSLLSQAMANEVQWSPSKTDTIGEVKSVLYKKVSFIQGLINAILIHFGAYTNVLYMKGVFNSGVSF